MKVKLRTKEYEVPSLTFSQVEAFAKDGAFERCPIVSAGLLGAPERRETAMAVILAALKNADEKITREELASEIDLDNYGRLMDAVMGVSRIKEGKAGAGEAVP